MDFKGDNVMRGILQFTYAIILSLLALNSNGQKPLQAICTDSISGMVHELREEFGTNKKYPKEYEPTFLTALSFYPDLAQAHIHVREKNIKTTMQCRPTFFSIFRKKENRRYNIFIDNRKKNDEGILYDELTFNAKIGIFGHELAHVVDYESKNGAEIVWLGMLYLNQNQRRHIEHDIDMIAIHQGLGYQLNDFATYVFEESQASEKYLEFKRKYYFQPFQMRRIIAQMPLYF